MIVLLDEQHDSIDEHGRARQASHLIYRVDTAKGVEFWASVQCAYWPWYQARPNIRARVLTADGVQHDLDPKTLTDSTPRDRSPAIYSDQHAYEGPLPAVAIGAVVEEEIVLEDTASFFEGVWSARYVIGRGVPVLSTKITFEAPASFALAYEDARDWPAVERTTTRLLARTESATLFRLVATSLARQKKWDDLAKLIQQHKGKLTDDVTAAQVEANAFMAQNQPAKAMEVLKALIESGKGGEQAINQYGWAAVMARDVKPEVIEMVQQTVQQPKNQNYAILHTLGCMYAEAGRVAQAQQTLLETMKHDRSVDAPESVIWYGFALLAEYYGEHQAAAKLYAKVEKPKNYEPEEQSTYALAQRRLLELESKPSVGATK